LLSEWRHLDAYVLLGEPGMGKSTAFSQECAADPYGSILITARDFVTIGLPAGSAGKTLFIDALDERRASSSTHSGPLDEIRIRLNVLGRPRFRLSCREAEWIQSDTTNLCAVASTGIVEELSLEPLDESEILKILTQWTPDRVSDPRIFLERANQQRVASLLGNPLLLDLLVEAVKGDHWPASRQETYLLACRSLAMEHNSDHRTAQRHNAANVESILNDSGILCALLLLSDSRSYVVDTASATSGEILIDDLPTALGVSSDSAVRVLSSKLFATEGKTRTPRHRTIVEFLAARSISHHIKNGLPMSRVLALMEAFDGRIVEPLRGLFAWLTTHCIRERKFLIERDPLGLVLYGDVHPFSTTEKCHILASLYKEGEKFRWFRNENWESHPFGALGTADMEKIFRALLDKPSREPAHQALLECVLNAIEHGEDMQSLYPSLPKIVRDSSYDGTIRKAALSALLKKSILNVTTTKRLLDQIANGTIIDSNDELMGRLLTALYPAHISANQVMKYFHPRKEANFLGRYHMFWEVEIFLHTEPINLPILADSLVEIVKQNWELLDKYEIQSFAGKLISKVVAMGGKDEPIDRLYRWLHGVSTKYGTSALKTQESNNIGAWLSLHPKRQKNLFAYALLQISPNVKNFHMEWLRCEYLLYGARRPRDWYNWMLGLASKTSTEHVAKICVERAALAVIKASDQFDIGIGEVTEWIAKHQIKWPLAEFWCQKIWTCDLNDWSREEFILNRTQAVERTAERSERQREMAPHLPKIYAGTAVPGLFHDIAYAYAGNSSFLDGNTPEERVQELLGIDAIGATRAIEGLKSVLWRTDLPTGTEVIKLHVGTQKRYYLIQPACLLAADILVSETSDVPLMWSDKLAQTLFAFSLVDGGNAPSWHTILAKQKSKLIRDIFLQYAQNAIQKEVHPHVVGLHEMVSKDGPTTLAQFVLPSLLNCFPEKATSAQIHLLNNTLLPASKCHLDADIFENILNTRLKNRKIDSHQRIALFVARLNDQKHFYRLTKFVGSDVERILQMGRSIENQAINGKILEIDDPKLLGQLIEILAPHASPMWPASGIRNLSENDEFGNLVRSLIQQLSSNSELTTGIELLRLRALPQLERWAITLEASHYGYSKLARATAFKYPTVSAVAKTLANNSPANAQDMMALLIDHLKLIAGQIRFDDTNSLRLFWRERANGDQKPKVENDCRDILHKMLRDRMLPLGVQIEKEPHAANDKRSDLHGSAVIDGQRVVVPIEIKKEDHPAVWDAWRDGNPPIFKQS